LPPGGAAWISGNAGGAGAPPVLSRFGARRPPAVGIAVAPGVQLLPASSLRCNPFDQEHLVKAPLPAAVQLAPRPLTEVALADVQGARGFSKAAVGGAVAVGVGVALIADDDRSSNGHSNQGYGPGSYGAGH
jgi:hypothetical protein